uniref:type-4 ice-structuring protein LS-12-like n=1 Tax=Oncorhynchus gorbuscha TaxID=8017 RepID=UPI001EAEB82C|nr:type-4 ice-structuring protein LS-12-like [Oncorhynchus gorbuscha]
MKFSIVAALVVVLAIGCESSSLVKRDIPAEIETLNKYFQDAIEKVKSHELISQAQGYLEEGKTQITPLTDKIQEQMKSFVSDIEEQVRPMADKLQAQFMPLVDQMQAQFKPLADDLQAQMEQLFQTVVDQTKALLPPQ